MITIAAELNTVRISFALQKLQALLEEKGYTFTQQSLQNHSRGLHSKSEATEIVIGLQDKELEDNYQIKIDSEVKAEGFEIRNTCTTERNQIFVLGLDETGLMYGIMELTEQLKAVNTVEQVKSALINARFPFRAIKFNLPWSSYRMNECFELQHQCVKDLHFWEQFFDMMLENRYNVLTLWNLHPFPYMFRTTNFPLATPFSDEELAVWKQYWTALFGMAKERGIETYLINWNIIVSEAFTAHYDEQAVHDKKYHYGDSYSTEQIKQYTKESIVQLINEYPDLTGFGVSLGERMNDMTPEARQAWIEEVYFEGMKEADRPIKFIHRAPFSVDPSITRTSIEMNQAIPEPVWLEVKFNWSHAYSSPQLLLTHGGSNGMEGYWNPAPTNYKVTWMVRNEDFFTLRWAQPSFVREHIRLNGQEYVGGYYIGSECFIPGIDYSHIPNSPHIHWDYAFQKHWLYYMLWGRLLYHPETKDDVFVQKLNEKLSISEGEVLLEAYSKVSKFPMALASYYKFTWDFTLYAEGFLATDESEYNNGQAFISLQDLIESTPFDPAYLSIKEYAKRFLKHQSLADAITPLQLADQLEKDAQAALQMITTLKNNDPRLECELADIEAWACLGLYFSKKLCAAVSYELYRQTNDEGERKQALYWLQAPHAAAHWEQLVAVTGSHYQEQPLMHLGKTPFTWALFLPQVYEDIDFVNAAND